MSLEPPLKIIAMNHHKPYKNHSFTENVGMHIL